MSADGKDFPSGSTIQLEIGYLKNAMSLQSSDPFYLSTYIEVDDSTSGSSAATKTIYKFNESKDQVRVTNSIPGPITITDFQHFSTEELSEAT